MEKLPRASYTAEFKQQAVAMVQNEGLGITQTAKRLSLAPATLKNWVYAARKGEPLTANKHQKAVTELEMEISRLKRELAQTKMERDLLKKAAAYFAKTSQ